MNRLIDADALMKAIYHRAFETDGDTMWQSGCWVRYRAIEQVVKEQPTIKPEPKTGKWIEDAETYYKAVNEKGGGVNENTPIFTDDIACSECLALFSVIDNETEHFNYCPNCGADMRGDKE